MSSRAPRPPLTKRMRQAHWMVLDFIVGLLMAGFFGLLMAVRGGLFSPAIAALLPLVVFAATGLRRRWPLACYAVLLLTAFAAHGFAISSFGMLIPSAYALYMVAVHGPRRVSLAALGAGLGLIATVVVVSWHIRFAAQSLLPGAFSIGLVLSIAWLIGYSAGQRRAYAALLRDEAASAAVAQERLRIARELHDIVAHSMSVIAVQAGFGQYVIDTDAVGAREALGAIAATSRDALDEMRRMLGVLRQQDSPSAAPLAPTSGLGDLERLAERTRGTGVAVTLLVGDPVGPISPGIALSAYRIIQEALTNVVKHAGPGATCVVRVEFTDEAVALDVTNAAGLAVAPSGWRETSHHGIAGMEERAALCGGTLSAGALPGGGFRVAARLPLAIPVLVGQA